MKKLILFLIVFLIAGSACAANTIDELKAPSGFEDMLGGYSESFDTKDIYFYISEMSFNDGAFDNISTEYEEQTVTELEDNIYLFNDTKIDMVGVEEKVKLDGKEQLVSIIDESGSGDVDSLLSTMREFNSINGLIPMEV